ncbi:hypothetical protein FOIG_04046 [Fusarium odoratissimum NRRL 54006]|uniref:Uncharacterized protein n=2 Tax=Fusarium oxysporum species complex TaxID=171631 RepID=X0JW82_FUSO5|nr:uncharacterized protein FOIG_04046 [Fusarium odoratissimum NRRL 54006]EXM05458.1 hypothetical protein FOIG_04046 [Fusarium odoratissimum NRRL 54006]TXC00435.1 hypothetical protein FocTR4_00014385 [Fusarium oxysporum f. sp. cubense]
MVRPEGERYRMTSGKLVVNIAENTEISHKETLGYMNPDASFTNNEGERPVWYEYNI